MYVHSKDHDSAVQSIRIEFGKMLGQDKDEDAWIELKELPAMELVKFNNIVKKDIDEALEYFQKILPRIIRKHNLMMTEDKEMTNKEVTDLLFEKFFIVSDIIEKYTHASFFSPMSKPKEKSKA